MRTCLTLGVAVALAIVGMGCASVPDELSETQKEYVRSAIAEHDSAGDAEFKQVMGLIAGLQELHEQQIESILDLTLKARRLEASLCLLDYQHSGVLLGLSGALFILQGDEDVDAENAYHAAMSGPSLDYYNENSSICSSDEGDLRLKQ